MMLETDYGISGSTDNRLQIDMLHQVGQSSLNNNNNDNKHAYAGTNDHFTHLRVLLVLQVPRHFGPIQLASLGSVVLYTSKSPIGTPSSAAFWANPASVADQLSFTHRRVLSVLQVPRHFGPIQLASLISCPFHIEESYWYSKYRGILGQSS
jgi:hypothetical protein